MRKIVLFCLLATVFLTACQDRTGLAPVWEGAAKERPYYKVRAGDTLFSIAWRYDKDYRKLAAFNHLDGGSRLKVGQILHLVPTQTSPTRVTKIARPPISRHTVRKTPSKKTRTVRKSPSKNKAMARKLTTKKIQTARKSIDKRVGTRWLWPATGKIVQAFSPKKHQKGIDIKGKLRAPVYASRAGRVAYSGDGLRGYGNLIIIRHSGEHLSAYAHNSKNMVKEGQKVKAHQKIAEMGSSGRYRGVLHFEIRHAGKPLDPLRMLARH